VADKWARARTTSAPSPWQTHVRCGDHEFVADEPDRLGGGDTGPSPYEYYAAALAGCTSITLRMYAARKGWDLTGLEVDVDVYKTEAGAPRIERVVRLSGDLDEAQRDRLLDIAQRTPVTLAVMHGAEVTTHLDERDAQG
jgi:putative redox protein